MTFSKIRLKFCEIKRDFPLCLILEQFSFHLSRISFIDSVKAAPDEGKFFIGKARGGVEKQERRQNEMMSELEIKRAERKAKRLEESKAKKADAPKVVIKDD